MFEKLPYLTPALADQRDDDHIRVGAANDVGKQGALREAAGQILKRALTLDPLLAYAYAPLSQMAQAP